MQVLNKHCAKDCAKGLQICSNMIVSTNYILSHEAHH